jgi:peptidoglycan hydrolase-like protein with peptidoglycan-binding domain
MEKLNDPIQSMAVIHLGPTPKLIRLTSLKVRQLQAILNRLGYSVGTPDGKAGPMTRKSVERFQRDAQLAMSGQFDSATVDMLEELNPGS